MHGYSTDSSERRVVPLLLALWAIGLAWITFRLLETLQLSFPWWVDPPSTMAYYGLLYKLFDLYLWKNNLVRKMGLVRVPNFSGRWRGYVLSSYDNHEKHYRLMMHIFQSWTHITVFLTTPTSMSCSCTAMIRVGDPSGASLVYQYRNQPLADAVKTMHMHFGTGELKLDGDSLTGEYYAGRDRRTFGRIFCKLDQGRSAPAAEPQTREPACSQENSPAWRKIA
jgi:SMODS-associating 2TM, beta-strand rich effector domain